MRYHTVAVDFLPPPRIGAAMRRIAALLARGEWSSAQPRHACGSAGPAAKDLCRFPTERHFLPPLRSAGDIATLPPLAYSLGSAAAALRQLSAARHVGKVVAADRSARTSAAADAGRWVISGGTGALGAAAARWLAAAGAKHIALLGRTGLAATAATASASDPAAVLAAATTAGSWAAAVTLHKCDAAAAADLEPVLQTTGSGQPRQPLAGVLHAGGVLADATLANQTLGGLRSVFAPKAAGTAHLATSAAATLQPLAAVQLFSSVAAALGSGGQANYAAANALLDAAASGMQRSGLPGVAVNWGAWAGAGMAAHAGWWRALGAWEGGCMWRLVCWLRASPTLPLTHSPAAAFLVQALSAWSGWALGRSAPAPAWPWSRRCCAALAPAQRAAPRCRRCWWPRSSSGTSRRPTVSCSRS